MATINTRILLKTDISTSWDTSTVKIYKGEAALSLNIETNKYEIRIGTDDTGKTWTELGSSNFTIPASNVIGLDDALYDYRLNETAKGTVKLQKRFHGLTSETDWIDVSTVSLTFTSGTAYSNENPIALKDYVDSEIGKITVKIPEEATSSNQLADKAFVNSSIEAVAAYFITKANSTKTESSGPFATKSELDTITATSGNVFWKDGKAISKENLSKNDYTVVLEDETRSIYIEGIEIIYSKWTSTVDYIDYYVDIDGVKTLVTSTNKDTLGIIPGTTVPYSRIDPTARYHYDGSTWIFQYAINSSGFTQAQWNAINSGTSSEWKNSIDTDIDTIKNTSIPSKADKVTNATEGNIAKLNSTGNLVDSGISASNIVLTDDSRLSDSRTTKESLTIGSGGNSVVFNGGNHVDIIAGSNVQLTKDSNGKAVISATNTTYEHASDKTQSEDLGLITKGELEKVTGASTASGSIAEAKKAADDAQTTADTNTTNLNLLDTRVGTIPATATATTVTAYAKEESDKKMQFLGVADTMPTDSLVTIGGSTKVATNGHVIIYNDEEYMFNGTTWIKFSSHSEVTSLSNNKVNKTTTIAGVDLQDDITKTELLTALNVADGAEVNIVNGAVDSDGNEFTITNKKIVLTNIILNGGDSVSSF